MRRPTLIDYLKTRVPFWENETTADGERWVAARDTDDTAAGRWQQETGDEMPVAPMLRQHSTTPMITGKI